MYKAMRDILGEILTSKKALATLAGLLVLILSRVGVDIEEGTVNKVLAILAVFVVGNGIADIGAPAVKIAAKTEPE